MNNSAKFQHHPLPYGFVASEEMLFENLFANSCCHGNQSNLAVWTIFIYIYGRGLLKEHFCKTFVKISAGR